MIEESKHCSDVMKKYFNKNLVMIKKDNEDFEKLLNVGLVMFILKVMLK